MDEGYPALPGPAWGVWLLAAVALTPAVMWALWESRPSLIGSTAVLGTAAAAVLLHLVIHIASGRLLAGVFAPPWAWGDLLADRYEGSGKRTAWFADVAAGTLTAVSGAVAGAIVLDAPPAVVPGIVLAGLLLLVLLRRMAMVSRRTAWAPIWTLTLPLRLLGAIPRVLVAPTR